MKHERIGPAREGEAGVLFTPANSPADSTTRLKKQRPHIPPLLAGTRLDQWKAWLVPDLFLRVELVSLDMLGPVHLLGEDGGPRVCIGYREAEAYVWLERRPWGCQWANANKQFISHDHVGLAVNYALRLAHSIRQAALAEEARLKRRGAVYLREKFGDGL